MPRTFYIEPDPNNADTNMSPALFAQGRPITPKVYRHQNMNAGQRLQAALAGPLGWVTFTPDQQWWRSTLGRGRWGGRLATEPGQSADRPANMVMRHADGTCDMIGLDAGGFFYFDLGGCGGRDTKAGRPR